MARFVLIKAVTGTPNGCGTAKYLPGRTFADTSGNALAGDLVWPALAGVSGPPNPVFCRPLDTLGQTALANAGFPGVAIVTGPPIFDGGGVAIGTGVDSESA